MTRSAHQHGDVVAAAAPPRSSSSLRASRACPCTPSIGDAQSIVEARDALLRVVSALVAFAASGHELSVRRLLDSRLEDGPGA